MRKRPTNIFFQTFGHRTAVILKGLAHAISGNLTKMVTELDKISKERLKTIEELTQNKRKPKRDIDGQNWIGLWRNKIQIKPCTLFCTGDMQGEVA